MHRIAIPPTRSSSVASSSRRQALRRRAARVLSGLTEAIHTPRVELAHRSPLELLIATILSAQCTDQRVNQVTPALFKTYPTAKAYADADPHQLEAMIRPTGFYKTKAKSIIACGKVLCEHFRGKVPSSMEELLTLPGVGRKTANVILGACFGRPAVVVDTHVKRVAHRLGFTESEDPDRIEEDLQRLIPIEQWTSGAQRLLLHGRYVCLARRPKCEVCAIYSHCLYKGKIPR